MAVLGLLLSAHAQEREITGSVKDHAGAGIVGVTILVEGTTKGTTSGADGSFSIKAAPDNVLVVSFMGYQSHTIKVGTQTRIDVVLKENTQAIDDVIVVAFGTAKKEAFTGSATVIKSDDIAKSQQSNVAQALAGKVAGVQLTNTSGQPGESPKIRIRGFSSLNAGNDPLWIVDGMPYSGDLNNLNPSDIESMTVLKDAASNSLYGARGANGVVMITTKKAKSQEAHVTIDAKWGVNSRAVQDYAYITNPAQFYELHYSALKNYYVNSGMSVGEAHLRANTNLTANANDGGLGYMVYTVPSGQEFIGINGKVNPAATLGRRLVYEGKEYYIRPDDWTDAAFRSSLRQEYNASISGQTGNASIYGSFGYLNNEGIAYNSDMDRYTARLRVDYQAKKWLKFGANANYTHFRYNQIDDSGAGNSSGNVFAYTTAVGPIYPLYIRDGEGMSCTTRTASSSTTTATATMPVWSVRSSPTATPSRIRVSTNRKPKAMLSTVRDISTSPSSRISSSRSTPAFRSTKPAPPRLRIPGSDSSPAKKAWSRKGISGISTSTCSRFSTTPSRSATITSM